MGNELPSVTHEGVLNIGGMSIRCFRLTDGQTVFHADDFGAFLRAWFDGEINPTEDEMKQAATFVMTRETADAQSPSPNQPKGETP